MFGKRMEDFWKTESYLGKVFEKFKDTPISFGQKFGKLSIIFCK